MRRLAGGKGRAKLEFFAEATPIINYVNQQTIHVYTRTQAYLASIT